MGDGKTRGEHAWRDGLMSVRLSQLSNGIRVVTSTIPRVESVAFGIWVGVGSRCESRKLGGISHFLEHLLFKGTQRRSPRQISMAIEGRGGYLNAFTQEENTCYYARVSVDQVWRAADVLVDMVRNARLDQADIEKERSVIVEEIMMYRDQPRHLVHDMLGEALWQNHPLGRPVIGTPETLAAMGRSEIAAFRDRHYVPRSTVLVFAGKVDHDACVRKAEQMVGDLAKGRAPSYRRASSDVEQLPVDLLRKDIEKTHLALGFRLFGRRDERRYPLRLLSVVLGENMSSRLFQIVREKHGLAYSVHSSLNLFKESGAFVISAGLDRKRNEKALELIVREVRRLKQRAVSRAELKRAKDYVIGQLRLGLESTSSQLMWLGDNLMCHGRVPMPDETIEKIRALTADDIQRLASESLLPGGCSLAAVSPDLDESRRASLEAILAGL